MDKGRADRFPDATRTKCSAISNATIRRLAQRPPNAPIGIGATGLIRMRLCTERGAPFSGIGVHPVGESLSNAEPEFRLALDTFLPAAVAMLTCLGGLFRNCGATSGALAFAPRWVQTPLFKRVARFGRSASTNPFCSPRSKPYAKRDYRRSELAVAPKVVVWTRRLPSTIINSVRIGCVHGRWGLAAGSGPKTQL